MRVGDGAFRDRGLPGGRPVIPVAPVKPVATLAVKLEAYEPAGEPGRGWVPEVGRPPAMDMLYMLAPSPMAAFWPLRTTTVGPPPPPERSVLASAGSALRRYWSRGSTTLRASCVQAKAETRGV